MKNNNPFEDSTNELNPFAQVDVYNPFDSYREPAPPTPAPATSYRQPAPPVPPPRSSPPRSPSPPPPPRPVSPPEAPELRFKETEYDEMEAFYRDEHSDSGIPAASTSPEAATLLPPTKSRTSGTARVTVRRMGEKYEVDDDSYNFWQPIYYRKYFNVDSFDVMVRCLRSMWPFKYDFMESVKDNPDFYGPFWISTTLIFMMAASANFAFYITTLIDPNAPKWTYDFYKLTYGSGVIYGYAFLVPFFLWLYMRWAELNVRLIEVVCIYGYSLFIYTPVALLCLIPVETAKWGLVAIGCGLSTIFLVVNLWMPLKEKLAHAIITLVIVAVLHVGLALTFRLYFFLYVSPST